MTDICGFSLIAMVIIRGCTSADVVKSTGRYWYDAAVGLHLELAFESIFQTTIFDIFTKILKWPSTCSLLCTQYSLKETRLERSLSYEDPHSDRTN
ncbi:hypothetical protein BU24DRAFT_284946 [Aaosphaeria arxii CBS 175.79]|uniref:Uncharacterized protein n=1 Tax=Aaosphaeria arxii CBS 175.79 TaxID=1450172 RepID=A0A6A5XEU4_9PLEO|nr:uncharacterized protein BU24DRAFT_284946 [Aaosphaeria arxii CBS 175.79]KAF2011612.1 hypothetical protein BU24DRAFT_284946 [Aaosphaeria arxii CBS 175.79]